MVVESPNSIVKELLIEKTVLKRELEYLRKTI